MNNRKRKKYFITRDIVLNGQSGLARECWTGERWSNNLDDVKLYFDLEEVKRTQWFLNMFYDRGHDPNIIVKPADIRQYN